MRRELVSVFDPYAAAPIANVEITHPAATSNGTSRSAQPRSQTGAVRCIARHRFRSASPRFCGGIVDCRAGAGYYSRLNRGFCGNHTAPRSAFFSSVAKCSLQLLRFIHATLIWRHEFNRLRVATRRLYRDACCVSPNCFRSSCRPGLIERPAAAAQHQD